jgi:lipase chaperone LimK
MEMELTKIEKKKGHSFPQVPKVFKDIKDPAFRIFTNTHKHFFIEENTENRSVILEKISFHLHLYPAII